MSLLDFLGGVAGAMPGIYDNIERREAEERRRKEIEAERERLRLENDRIYQRNRQDTLADRAEQRAYTENSAAAERARLRGEIEQSATGYVGARNGLLARDVNNIRAAEGRYGEVGPDGMGPALPDDMAAKARRVFSEANEVISRRTGGEPMKSVADDLDARKEKERRAGLTEEQLAAEGRRERILKGGNPDLDEARQKQMEAQTAVLLNKAEGVGGSGSRNADPDFRKRLTIYDGQVKRAESAEALINKSLNSARDEMDEAREGSTPWNAAKKKVDRYTAELAAASKKTDEARTRYAEFEAGGSSARGRAQPENEAGPLLSRPMEMARNEAVSSNQPVQYDIGGKRGSFAAGSGAQIDAATAIAQAKQVISRNPGARNEVLRRLKAAGIDATGL